MATGKKLSGLSTIESLQDDDLIYVVRPSEWAGERSKGITKQDFLDGLAGTPEGTAIKSTGVTTGYVLQADGDNTSSWVALAGGGNAQTANPLSQFAATTKAQLDGVISDGNVMYVGDVPTSHTHTASEVSDFDTEVSNNASVTANTAKVSYTDGAQVSTNTSNISTLQSEQTTQDNAIALNTTHRGVVTGNPHAVSKSDVGLSNVDNTSDANKPVSTAQQTEIDTKQDSITLTTTGSSGAATLIGSTLNIPQYSGGGASKYSETFGNGADTTITITHSLGSEDVIAQIREVSSKTVADCQITIIDSNSLNLIFNTAPTTNEYRVTIIA